MAQVARRRGNGGAAAAHAASLGTVPTASPPPLEQLRELAGRAVTHLDGFDGQVAAVWERVRGSEAERDATTVTFTAVLDGRAATATAAGPGDVHLARAAKAAAVNARRPRAWPAPPLPEPAAGRPHDGWDPGVLTWSPTPDDGLTWEAAAARVAIASTRGVDVAEQRSHALARLHRGAGGRRVVVGAAAIGPYGLDLAALAAEAEALDLEEAAEPPSFSPVVLGPQAVATLLDHLRPAFGVHLDVGGGPLAGRQGTRVAAPAVNLSDSARHPATLPRSYDAEGVPRQPVPLIQDGVAHRRVHDSASASRTPGAASTGHATRAGALAPLPEHLVLAGGGADGLEDLWAPVADGVYVPALARTPDGGHETRGAVRLRDGVPAGGVSDRAVTLDPLAALASVEALGSRQRLVALPGHTPGGLGAATVPALRCRDGIRPGA